MFPLFIFGCSNQKRIGKRLLQLQTDYQTDLNIDANLKKLHSMKKYKLIEKKLEHTLALGPDSTVINSTGGTDYYYRNKNKIKYILSHNLKTENIHFIE